MIGRLLVVALKALDRVERRAARWPMAHNAHPRACGAQHAGKLFGGGLGHAASMGSAAPARKD